MAVSGYRDRVQRILRSVLEPHVPFRRALDFGCGDGWFAHRFEAEGWADEVLAVDVRRRCPSFARTTLYDGQHLPFEDRSFDLAYGIDALHHCRDPLGSLTELLRCTGRFLLLKDHTYRSVGGKVALMLLDEVGNRPVGVSSIHRYQRGWEWLPEIEGAGFRLEGLVHPAPCHPGLLGWATNALQFVGMWRRIEA